MNEPYKAEDFDATELTKVIANACNCAYIDGYKQGRADAEKELKGLKDLGKLYSEIRVEVIEELRELMKQYVNYENVDIFIEALRQLENQNKSKNLKF